MLMKTHSNDKTEKNLHDSVAGDKLVEFSIEAETEIPIGLPCISSNCEQCDYTNPSEKGLNQHKMMKHRISRFYGLDDTTDIEVTALYMEISESENAPCPLCPVSSGYCYFGTCDECKYFSLSAFSDGFVYSTVKSVNTQTHLKRGSTNTK